MLSVECKYKIVKSANSPLKSGLIYKNVKNPRGGLGGPPSIYIGRQIILRWILER
jgi:hypothetical protein